MISAAAWKTHSSLGSGFVSDSENWRDHLLGFNVIFYKGLLPKNEGAIVNT